VRLDELDLGKKVAETGVGLLDGRSVGEEGMEGLGDGGLEGLEGREVREELRGEERSRMSVVGEGDRFLWRLEGLS
jgi:hypothetical protein